MKEHELKPCPFCGGKVRRFHGYTGHGVTCMKCTANVRGLASKGSATRAWNRRADNEQREAD